MKKITITDAMLGVFNEGNYGEYSLKNIETISDSPLNGKTIIFLGSSVTAGYGSLGVSFADFLEKTDSIIAIKEAVSGTTLVDVKNSSYACHMREVIDKMDNETYELYLKYHFKTCERQDLIGLSHHTLDVLRKE